MVRSAASVSEITQLHNCPIAPSVVHHRITQRAGSLHADLDNVAGLHGPTPGGVPVAIKSPGNRVITWEMKRIITSSGKMKSRVVPCWRTSPLTRVSTLTPSQGSSSLETRGPTGQKVSKPL